MGDVAALTWPLTRPGGPLPLPQSRARRCLFGPVDREKTNLLLQEHMSKILQEGSERWNFDFEAGMPLPGRYNWREVEIEPPTEQKEDCPKVGAEAPKREEQTCITDFMRKRKSSSSAKESSKAYRKIMRRSST